MTLELLLFVGDGPSAERAAGFGVDGVVVDLEVRGKTERQWGFDTQISPSVPSDVARLRRHTRLPMTVRLNGPAPPAAELETVLASGADEVLVPMVRTVAEVDAVLDRVDDRVPVSCMIETEAVLEILELLAARPIHRFYVGLNDLRIELGRPSIFDALVDGTVDGVVRALHAAPVGVAGLTHPSGGSPLACQAILDELVRIGARFTFLRRSFVRDLSRWDGREIVDAIRQGVAASQLRSDEERSRDHAALVTTVLGPTMIGRPT